MAPVNSFQYSDIFSRTLAYFDEVDENEWLCLEKLFYLLIFMN